MAAPASRGLVDGEFMLTAEDFRSIAEMLRADAGIALPEAKATLLYSRLAKRLRALGLTNFRQYRTVLASPAGEEERAQMLAALTTNVTRFFREPHHFEHLADTVLPPLLRAARAGGRVRLWSAACSSGEEAYSLALTILEALPEAARLDVRVLATDIDPVMLSRAQASRYSGASLQAVPPSLRQRWFRPVGEGHWEAHGDLRRLVVVRPLNLVGEWPMRGTFDAVFCRNVAIYFDAATQAALWERFVPLLSSGGHLYIGHSERVSGAAAPEFESAGITIYRRKAA